MGEGEWGALQPGDQVGSYIVEFGLGEGSMATVFRARHAIHDTVHALKLVELPRRALHRRLWAEGQVHSKVAHPNVVGIQEMLVHKGAPVLILEHVDGPTLADLLAEGPPPLSLVDSIARDLIAGLRAIHQAGIVHRDLKPANVLLERLPEGRVRAKIGDFGIARLQEGIGLTRAGLPLGTPRYMAPEQWRDAHSVDERADLYSIGAILYEMLADRFAFPGQQTEAVRELVLAGRFTPLRVLRPDVPERMARAVHACLQLDVLARPADCDSLLALWTGECSTELSFDTLAPMPAGKPHALALCVTVSRVAAALARRVRAAQQTAGGRPGPWRALRRALSRSRPAR